MSAPIHTCIVTIDPSKDTEKYITDDEFEAVQSNIKFYYSFNLTDYSLSLSDIVAPPPNWIWLTDLGLNLATHPHMWTSQWQWICPAFLFQTNLECTIQWRTDNILWLAEPLDVGETDTTDSDAKPCTGHHASRDSSTFLHYLGIIHCECTQTQ